MRTYPDYTITIEYAVDDESTWQVETDTHKRDAEATCVRLAKGYGPGARGKVEHPIAGLTKQGHVGADGRWVEEPK